ncbi:MAG: hypothetical protein ACOH2K_04935 [Burkholderiaceae bacterium]
MTSKIRELGLAIESKLTIPEGANYCPDTWPPRPDFPVTIDAKGIVISRYADPIWRLDPWSKVPMVINFGDGTRRNRKIKINSPNAELLRQIAAFFLWGPKPVRYASTLRTRTAVLRPIFVICSASNIQATELARHPKVLQKIAERYSPGRRLDLLCALHDMHEHREFLGFSILDRDGITYLAAAIPNSEIKQTPYIPPRIWSYQIDRLRRCMEEYSFHETDIGALYQFSLRSYEDAHGSLENLFESMLDRTHGLVKKVSNRQAVEKIATRRRFNEIAEKFNVRDLFIYWLHGTNNAEVRLCTTSLGSYLHLVRYVCLAYILNFTLMRVSEGYGLRASCLEIERDVDLGDIYIVAGKTTKTIQDDDARWPTSPSVKLAVDVLRSIAKLQLSCSVKHPEFSGSSDDVNNPCLMQRSFEPWARNQVQFAHLCLRVQNYEQVVLRFPHLFDPEELRITQDDFNIARLLTPSLDTSKFGTGKIWPLSWHQLRRTGSVNMQASGIVSGSSLQYLLKHSSIAMSMYYAHGYSRLRLNDEVRKTYIGAMYEALSHQLLEVTSSRYISPHGDKRKDQIIRLIDKKEIGKLEQLTRSGAISCKEILLGYCMNRSPCPFGGIESIAHCGGGIDGTACSDVLYDEKKLQEISELQEMLKEKLAHSVDGPLRESLLAQLRSAENYLNTVSMGRSHG